MSIMIKIVGAMIVISAGLLCGIYLRIQIKKRSEVLTALVSSLIALQNQVSYGLDSLEESFHTLRRTASQPVSEFYENCEHDLGQTPKIPFCEIWKKNIEKLVTSILFIGAEKDILIDLGKTLGISDYETQLRSIELAVEQLKAIKKVSDEELAKKSKLASGLSVILSAIVILITI